MGPQRADRVRHACTSVTDPLLKSRIVVAAEARRDILNECCLTYFIHLNQCFTVYCAQEIVMILEDKLRNVVSRRKADVFLRADFAKMGSDAQLSRALRKLIDEGTVVKIGIGVYAKAKRSKLSGKPIPVMPVEFLASQALEKLGVKIYPSRLTVEYNTGRTTQIPAGVVINTGNRRISRKLGFGSRTVKYENNYRQSTGLDRRATR